MNVAGVDPFHAARIAYETLCTRLITPVTLQVVVHGRSTAFKFPGSIDGDVIRLPRQSLPIVPGEFVSLDCPGRSLSQLADIERWLRDFRTVDLVMDYLNSELLMRTKGDAQFLLNEFSVTFWGPVRCWLERDGLLSEHPVLREWRVDGENADIDLALTAWLEIRPGESEWPFMMSFFTSACLWTSGISTNPDFLIDGVTKRAAVKNNQRLMDTVAEFLSRLGGGTYSWETDYRRGWIDDKYEFDDFLGAAWRRGFAARFGPEGARLNCRDVRI